MWFNVLWFSCILHVIHSNDDFEFKDANGKMLKVQKGKEKIFNYRPDGKRLIFDILPKTTKENIPFTLGITVYDSKDTEVDRINLNCNKFRGITCYLNDNQDFVNNNPDVKFHLFIDSNKAGFVDTQKFTTFTEPDTLKEKYYRLGFKTDSDDAEFTVSTDTSTFVTTTAAPTTAKQPIPVTDANGTIIYTAGNGNFIIDFFKSLNHDQVMGLGIFTGSIVLVLCVIFAVSGFFLWKHCSCCKKKPKEVEGESEKETKGDDRSRKKKKVKCRKDDRCTCDKCKKKKREASAERTDMTGGVDSVAASTVKNEDQQTRKEATSPQRSGGQNEESRKNKDQAPAAPAPANPAPAAANPPPGEVEPLYANLGEFEKNKNADQPPPPPPPLPK